jgi:methionyl-tRNA formyltransferase
MTAILIGNNPLHKIENLIRAMAPQPGAFTFHENKRLKIFKAIPVQGEKNAIPGTVLKGFENEVRVASGQDKGLCPFLKFRVVPANE